MITLLHVFPAKFSIEKLYQNIIVRLRDIYVVVLRLLLSFVVIVHSLDEQTTRIEETAKHITLFQDFHFLIVQKRLSR